jgi:invasion protein IalB
MREGASVRLLVLITAVFVTIGWSDVATAADIPGVTVHTHWQKFCFDNRQTGFKRICNIRAEERKHDDNSLLAAVELIERDGEAKKILRVTFPLGMLIVHGTRLIVYGIDPQQSPYVACTAAGCMSDYDATPALLGSMRVGQELLVQAIDQWGKAFSVTLSLADFWAAFDGPRTTSLVSEIE